VSSASSGCVRTHYRTARGAALASVSVLSAFLVGLVLALPPLAVAGNAPDRAILFLFPRPDEVRPWVPDGPAQLAEGQELFALIDGGAELFLRNGFERAAVQNYTLAPDRHIQAEIYMMRSMEGAAEVFTRKSGPGERPMALGDGGAKGEYYIVFHRGRFVVTVAAGDATAGAEAAVLRIARAIESRIPNRCP
jgi:hypothetical protein